MGFEPQALKACSEQEEAAKIGSISWAVSLRVQRT